MRHFLTYCVSLSCYRLNTFHLGGWWCLEMTEMAALFTGSMLVYSYILSLS